MRDRLRGQPAGCARRATAGLLRLVQLICRSFLSRTPLMAAGGIGTGRHHAESAVRAQRVVLLDAAGDHDPGLEQAVELLALQELVANRAVEALGVGVPLVEPLAMKAWRTPRSARKSASEAAMNSCRPEAAGGRMGRSWHDPTSGTDRAVKGSPFRGPEEPGPHRAPDHNHEGDHDWVLVLRAA